MCKVSANEYIKFKGPNATYRVSVQDIKYIKKLRRKNTPPIPTFE
jgi:hypothetical protein